MFDCYLYKTHNMCNLIFHAVLNVVIKEIDVFVIEFLIVLVCILIGARIGGIGLGVMGGVGLAILSFV